VTELPAVVVQGATALGLDLAGLRGLRGGVWVELAHVRRALEQLA